MSGEISRAQEGAHVGLSQEKACQMLEEGMANGQPLTPAQRRLFGAVCSGQAPRRAADGTITLPRDLHLAELDVLVQE